MSAIAFCSVPKTPIKFVLLSSIISDIVALFTIEARFGNEGFFVAFALIVMSLGFIRFKLATGNGRRIGFWLKVTAPEDNVGSAKT